MTQKERNEIDRMARKETEKERLLNRGNQYESTNKIINPRKRK